jgi:hypothetical protein
VVSRQAHSRRGGPVKGFYNKNNVWVNSTNRRDANVSASRDFQKKQIDQQVKLLTAILSPLNYLTKCWECGELVHFYRSEEGGCALFDMIGYPWPIHACWENRQDHLLEKIAGELNTHGFNGRTYFQNRHLLKKPKKQASISITGFVDGSLRRVEKAFVSHRGVNPGVFNELRFVPESDASCYYLLYVPSIVGMHFPTHSCHTLDAAWKKHGGRWHLFLSRFRRLRVNGRAEKIVNDTVGLKNNCFYCGTDLVKKPWGFDTNFQPECRECGRRRMQMSGDEYIAYIKKCNRRIRKAK